MHYVKNALSPYSSNNTVKTVSIRTRKSDENFTVKYYAKCENQKVSGFRLCYLFS
jgi:hypothetical protein